MTDTIGIAVGDVIRVGDQSLTVVYTAGNDEFLVEGSSGGKFWASREMLGEWLS